MGRGRIRMPSRTRLKARSRCTLGIVARWAHVLPFLYDSMNTIAAGKLHLLGGHVFAVRQNSRSK
jgi:hypothetical protein